MSGDEAVAPWRGTLRRFVGDARFQRGILALIVLNAITLGLETSPAVMGVVGEPLRVLDHLVVAIFTVEVTLRIVAWGGRFFRDPWSLFDFVVVGISLVPATDTFSVLRSLRVLRILRIASASPRMRRVVEALLGALPGLASVVSILALVFYVAAVMATNLFGADYPEWFGTIGRSLYSLFQVMTLESWSMGIVRPVMQTHPWAWAFFVPFILIATFTMLNLFVAVVVSAMQSTHHAEEADEAKAAHVEREHLLDEVRALRAEVRDLAAKLGGPG